MRLQVVGHKAQSGLLIPCNISQVQREPFGGFHFFGPALAAAKQAFNISELQRNIGGAAMITLTGIRRGLHFP